MQGVWTALITPFRNHELDLSAFKKILHRQAEAGISGVVVSGTTGESPTLSRDEKKTLILTALQELKDTPVKVAVGTGSYNTKEAVEFSSWASKQGVDAVLVVTPYYNKPSQAGLEAHFRAIADAIECEMILYNVPGRTGVSLTAETIAKLASHPKITTLKEATGNLAFASEILNQLSLRGQHIDLLSGDDPTFLPLLSLGAVGIISVASNLFPKPMVALQKSFQAGDLTEARRLHSLYYPLFRDLFIEPNPVPIKYVMSILDSAAGGFKGECEPEVRLPLVPLLESTVSKLKASLLECGLTSARST